MEKPLIFELQDTLRNKHKTLHRAEGYSKYANERVRKRAAFISNPFAKRLLGDMVILSVWLKRFFPMKDSDQDREKNLRENNTIVHPEQLKTIFDLKAPTLKELKEVILTARSSSAPGPSSVCYSIFKQCSNTQVHLWKLLRAIWKRGRMTK